MTDTTTNTPPADDAAPAAVYTNPKPGTWYATVTRPDATHIKVTVRYDLGGMCYATYKNKPRGYYLSIGPVTVESRENGIRMERFGMFSHAAYVLEETKRLNAKRIEHWYDRIGAMLPELVAASHGEKDERNAAIFALIKG